MCPENGRRERERGGKKGKGKRTARRMGMWCLAASFLFLCFSVFGQSGGWHRSVLEWRYIYIYYVDG